MKNTMKNWLINVLGGVTQEDAEKDREELRNACEVFALKHLHPKGISPVHPRQPLVGVDTEEDIVLYVSKTSVVNCSPKEIHVAPWTKEATLVGCRLISENKTK